MISDNRDIVVRFKVTKDERATIETEARHLGLSVSSFIRLIINRYVDKIQSSVLEG